VGVPQGTDNPFYLFYEKVTSRNMCSHYIVVFETPTPTSVECICGPAGKWVLMHSCICVHMRACS